MAEAQKLEAFIVQAKQGALSDAQIQQMLLEKFGKNLRPRDARKMIEMVSEAHGLPPSKIGPAR
jgi:hypothetical protein